MRPLKTRCKFKCHETGMALNGDTKLYSAKLSPVCSDEEGSENKQFWEWTPSGSFHVATANKNIFELVGLLTLTLENSVYNFKQCH